MPKKKKMYSTKGMKPKRIFKKKKKKKYYYKKKKLVKKFKVKPAVKRR